MKFAFDTQNLVFPLYEATLDSVMPLRVHCENDYVSYQSATADLFLQLMLAVKQLAELDIVHRDIKPQVFHTPHIRLKKIN